MLVNIGINKKLKDQGKENAIIWDFFTCINPHWLIIGMSGAGKTFRIKNVVNQIAAQSSDKLRVHVFDVHDDIDIEGESSVMYSEMCDYGINPLELSADLHSGGVRKKITSFINVLEKTTAKLGSKQAGILRGLMLDLYSSRGFDPNNPDSWTLSNAPQAFQKGSVYLDVPFGKKDEAKALGAKWDTNTKSWYVLAEKYTGDITKFEPRDITIPRGQTKAYPTLADLVKFTKEKTEEAFFGVGREAMKALQEFHRTAKIFNAKAAKTQHPEDEDFEELSKKAEKVREAVGRYLDVRGTNKTLKDAMLYSSVDTLNSIMHRLGVINSSGVFKSTPPPFDPNAVVRRHRIKSLGADEQKMFVLFSLEQLFERALERGPTKELVDLIVIDEAHKFFDDDPTNILNTIAKEARKFGVGLICASQAPHHFSEDFLSSVATKLVLGIDEMYWEKSTKKLRIDLNTMKQVTPRKTILSQIKSTGEGSTGWNLVDIST